MNISYKAPSAELLKLENLWFQLSKISCNLKCKHCYLDCHQDSRKRNFLSDDKIINAFKTNLSDLKMIYLTGGEPFLHPKFNEIVKYCLKKSNVTICSNGTLINEKKIKVLKNFEEESQHNIIFKLSLDHYMEGRNDEYRGSGVFKKVINALKLAQKYNIKAGLNCANLKNEDEKILRAGFHSMFEKYDLNMDKNNIKIIPMLKMGNYAKYYNMSNETSNVSFEDLKNFDMNILDCKTSRVISIDGVYSCPALVNDPRGKLGDNLNAAVKNVYLETQTCYNCVKRNDRLFG